MSKVLFGSLAELVGEIMQGDTRAAYSVGYRGKDFYALAASEDEAAGAVAMSLGMEVGLVPLDLIVAAARRIAAAAPAKPSEFTFDRDVFSKMAVADLKEYAGKNGIEIPGKGKEAIVDAIAAYWAAKNDPNQAKLPLGDAGEGEGEGEKKPAA